MGGALQALLVQGVARGQGSFHFVTLPGFVCTPVSTHLGICQSVSLATLESIRTGYANLSEPLSGQWARWGYVYLLWSRRTRVCEHT